MVYSAYTPTRHGSYVIYLSEWASLLARVCVDLDLAVSHGPRGGPKCVRVLGRGLICHMLANLIPTSVRMIVH